MKVASISEYACVLEPRASARSRVQETSYNMATKPDTPMATSARRSCCGVNSSTVSTRSGGVGAGAVEAPSCVARLAARAIKPTARLIAAPRYRVTSRPRFGIHHQSARITPATAPLLLMAYSAATLPRSSARERVTYRVSAGSVAPMRTVGRRMVMLAKKNWIASRKSPVGDHIRTRPRKAE